jgi:acyl transferase domain-containing protein/SAM-dependent methyltransferase
MKKAYDPQSIAVIGMACRFPDASSTDAFWNLLYEGRTVDRPVPSHRLPLEGHWRNPPGLNPRGYFLDEVDVFDHKFFHISPREAAAMDPQQRLLLETAYQALESAGYFTHVERSTEGGCYIGGFSTDYNDNIASHRTSAFSALGALKGFQSGRISHSFGWTGPSVTIDTVCSSSGVAIDAACKALIAGDCDFALAGGVSLFTSPFVYQNLAGASFLSPEARIKPFDASADGYARGEGVGLVVLKPVGAALQAGDPILGVVCASMVRQSSSLHITVPHSPSQAELYRRVLHQAGVDPHEVTYIETHGTGTRIGDAPEYEAIKQVFGGPRRQQTLHFASLKGNIGHVEGASGVASLIKTLLMMQHGQIPPQASFHTLNPRIELDGERLAIPTNVHPWVSTPDRSRFAIVNNFGAAGSISALVVQEGTAQSARHAYDPWMKYPVCLTAHTPSSLVCFCDALLRYIDKSNASLGNLCFALFRRTNHSLPLRRCFAVSHREELRDKLRQLIGNMQSSVEQTMTAQEAKPVVLAFGGQSSRHISVTRELFDSCAVFRSHLEACDEIVAMIGHSRLIPGIFHDTKRTNAFALQTMQFTLQYCCARSWIDCGLRVDCILGHSLGQLVALVVSGYLSLEDGLRFVCGRASLIDRKWGNDTGGMVSVQTDHRTVEAICQRVKASNPSYQVEIACHNGPTSYVLVGNSAEVSTLLTVLDQQFESVKFTQLNVTHGFHSKLTQPILDDLRNLASTLSFHSPTAFVEMCGDKPASEQLTAETLVEHTRNPVFFAQAVDRIQHRLGACVWIEAWSNAIPMLRSTLHDTSLHTFCSVQLNHASIADTTAQLWSCGYGGSFWPFHPLQSSRYSSLQLPPYQFDKARHWLEWSLTSQTERKDDLQRKDPVAPSGLLRPLGDGSSSFRVNTDSSEWISLVLGHLVQGKPIVPASLYLDLVIQAVRLFQNPAHARLMPRIDAVRICSPLGVSQGEQVTVHLDQDAESDLEWRFICKKDSAHSSIAAVGRITLLPRTPGSTSEFLRTARLLRTSQSAIDSVGSEQKNILQQPLIYKLLSQAVYYEPCYRALEKASFDRTTIRARATLSSDQSTPQATMSSLPIEACIQVAGLHAISLGLAKQPDNVFVCFSMDSVQFRDFPVNVPNRSLELIATIVTTSETDTVYDIYALDGTSGEVLLILSRVTFRRASSSSLRKNTSQPTIHSKAQHNQNQHWENEDTTKLQRLVSMLTGIPVKEIYLSSRLVNLGIDSLMLAELQREICDAFGLSLSLQDLQMDTFGELENLIVNSNQGLASHTTQDQDDSSRLKDILSQHIDVPANINPCSRLVDLGADSLLAMEVINDIKQSCDPDLDFRKVTPETTFGDLSALLPPHSSLTSSRLPIPFTSSTPCKSEIPDRERVWKNPPQKALNHTKRAVHTFAREVGSIDFWQNVCPLQTQLLQAYILEACEQQGINLRSLPQGQPIPNIPVLPKYERLQTVLLDILREGEIVDFDGQTYFRSDQPITIAPSSTLHNRITSEFSEYRIETELLQVTGSRLAGILIGEDDPLQYLFGDPSTNRLLERLYTDSPMFLLMNKLLAHFLGAAATSSDLSRPLRVLEIGAGTGGSTSWVLESLVQTKVPLEYVYSDISPSLVSVGRRKFGHRTDVKMQFSVLDIEQPGPKEMQGSFDVIISTLCIHATRNITKTLQNIRQLLRPDGFVALAEFTRRIPWLDLVFGLLDGWWVHSDERQHALTSVAHWHQAMRDAGFPQVDATGGHSSESQTGQIVCAFQSESEQTESLKKYRPRLSDIESETICFRQSDIHLRADIYFPHDVAVLPARKWPVGE